MGQLDSNALSRGSSPRASSSYSQHLGGPGERHRRRDRHGIRGELRGIISGEAQRYAISCRGHWRTGPHLLRRGSGATTEPDRVLCRRQYFSSVDPLVNVGQRRSVGNDDLRHESLHSVLCGLTPLVLSPQFGDLVGADLLTARDLLFSPRGPLSPRLNAKDLFLFLGWSHSMTRHSTLT